MYVSTRGGLEKLSAAEAIKKGIAADGGLFVPTNIPSISAEEIENLANSCYQKRAVTILRKFLTDYTDAELEDCVNESYTMERFDDKEIAPLVEIDPGTTILELWHGPTSAFKDMALQLLPRLLAKALKKTDEAKELVILVATSGDTGKAALEGFKDVEQTKIIVFYPENGVSQIQKLQMVTQQGNNVHVAAVRGNFDDAQTGVKKIFNDSEFSTMLSEHGYSLSSANSINWGRLVPQIIYYFSAYADLVKRQQIKIGDRINFAVPTGNFGNILAGYYAKLMGLPVNKLICASNQNNVLTDFIKTGKYDRQRTFYKTLSPSMDILISSNLERLLYHITGNNATLISDLMKELLEKGHYQIEQHHLDMLTSTFWADWVSDETALAAINKVHSSFGYLLDPHTAVAWQVAENYRNETGDNLPLIVLSTASPFKFNDSVLQAIITGKVESSMGEFDKLAKISAISGLKVPKQLEALKTAKPIHSAICDKEQMKQYVKGSLLT